MYYNKKNKRKRKSKKGRFQSSWAVFAGEVVFLASLYLIVKYGGVGYVFLVAGEIAVMCVTYAYNRYFWEAKNKRFKESGIADVDFFSGEDFENFLAYHYRKQGYEVELTPKTKDFGADLILKDKRTHKKTVVQAKRYADKVGIKAIQEVVSAKSYYKADFMRVVTNNQFTNEAEKLAVLCNVELWNRNRVVSEFLLSEVQNFKQSDECKTKHKVCPYCEGILIEKNGVYGKFLGCTNYPKCKYTAKIK